MPRSPDPDKGAGGNAAPPPTAPTQQEQPSIERALKAAGYVSWEEIGIEDDGPYWDIDDARRPDKTRWDVKLPQGSCEILSQEADR
ncbi:hypothetical protein C725_1690 [Pacificimonas flava]|uniref:PepSY domain-containing protein n=2 Tax=Pacificimonas flava TaxID=1234595 RepID=M2U4Y3_9SPHN|nr:hypothetical protein C725_1690 [Pacificimonas flava]